MTPPLGSLPITTLAPMLASREVTAVELVEACLDRIAARDPALNAFIAVLADAARDEARRMDAELAANRCRGPLHGVPISVKDLIDVGGVPTTAGSRVRAGLVAERDATVVARLREAGAVVVGKCNLHEFAFGTTGEDSAFGPTRNPHGPDRSPGGSSGGSAVAVVTGMSVASIGTDTGGSIRIPSAACGAVGLKPTYGELPCDGVVPLSRSLDHVGPIARSVNDAWLLYRCMAGDPRPAPLAPHDAPRPDAIRLGLPRHHFLDHLDDDVRAGFDGAVARLRTAGCPVRDVTIGHASDIAAIYLHIVLPEAAAYHAPTLEARAGDYTRPVRLRLEMGRYVLAEDYVRAQRGRDALRGEVDRALQEVDALALPTLAIPAPPLGATSIKIGSRTDSVRNVMLRLTQPFNLTGHPAISVPCGMTSHGLPCGLQLVGAHGRTSELLKLAFACERALAGAG